MTEAVSLQLLMMRDTQNVSVFKLTNIVTLIQLSRSKTACSLRLLLVSEYSDILFVG